MFTGLIQQRAQISSFEKLPEGNALLRVLCTYPDLQLGESIAVDGVCLTVAEIHPLGEEQKTEILFFVSGETLRCTSLGSLRTVNLERALRVGDRMGGHWVQGHVDGIGRVELIEAQGEAHELKVSLPPSLHPFCVEKGSLTLNGVSLTINQIADGVCIRIIPHTWNETNLSELKVGSSVHVEVDILAKYVAQNLKNLEKLCPSN